MSAPESPSPTVLKAGEFARDHLDPHLYLAIAAGPYRLSVHPQTCATCGSDAFVRRFHVSTLAVIADANDAGFEHARTEVRAMDEVDLYLRFRAANWIVPDETGGFVALGRLFCSLPGWFREAVNRAGVRMSAPYPRILTHSSSMVVERDGLGRQHLQQICRFCRSALPSMPDAEARCAHTLECACGFDEMRPWALVMELPGPW